MKSWKEGGISVVFCVLIAHDPYFCLAWRCVPNQLRWWLEMLSIEKWMVLDVQLEVISWSNELCAFSVPLWCSISCNHSPITEWPHHQTKREEIAIYVWTTINWNHQAPKPYHVLRIAYLSSHFSCPFWNNASFFFFHLFSAFCFLLSVLSVFSFFLISFFPASLISYFSSLLPNAVSLFPVPRSLILFPSSLLFLLFLLSFFCIFHSYYPLYFIPFPWHLNSIPASLSTVQLKNALCLFESFYFLGSISLSSKSFRIRVTLVRCFYRRKLLQYHTFGVQNRKKSTVRDMGIVLLGGGWNRRKISNFEGDSGKWYRDGIKMSGKRDEI